MKLFAQINITKTQLSLATALLLTATVSQAALSVPSGNNLVVNDDALNIAWTQNGNLFKTQASNFAGGSSAFVTAVINASSGVINDTPTALNSGTHTLLTSDFDAAAGTMSWWGAQAWVNYLNTTSYAGETGWRLPTLTPVNGVNLEFNVSYNGTTDRGFNGTLVNPTASELAHLYYNDLGNIGLFNTAAQPQAGSGLVNSGPFSNIAAGPYWFGTEHLLAATGAPDVGTASWVFSFGHGGQGISGSKSVMYYGFAVHDGLVSAVPVPGAAWLMGSAILGLLGVSRRKSTV